MHGRDVKNSTNRGGRELERSLPPTAPCHGWSIVVPHLTNIRFLLKSQTQTHSPGVASFIFRMVRGIDKIEMIIALSMMAIPKNSGDCYNHCKQINTYW